VIVLVLLHDILAAVFRTMHASFPCPPPPADGRVADPDHFGQIWIRNFTCKTGSNLFFHLLVINTGKTSTFPHYEEVIRRAGKLHTQLF